MLISMLSLLHHSNTLPPPVMITGGYDSDVEREKKLDYGSMTYAVPIRDPGIMDLVKPHKQEVKPKEKPGSSKQGTVSRGGQGVQRVVSSGTDVHVTVSNNKMLEYIVCVCVCVCVCTVSYNKMFLSSGSLSRLCLWLPWL